MQYAVYDLETSKAIAPMELVKDINDRLAVFLSVASNITQVIVLYMDDTKDGQPVEDGVPTVAYAVDFGLRVVQVPEAFASYRMTPEGVSVELRDGRTVALFPDGRLQVFTPDKMHGSEFMLPPGIEWGGSHDLRLRNIKWQE